MSMVNNQLQWSELKQKINDEVQRTLEQVIDWRRDFHQFPELGNQEFRTAGIVADHLKRLGLDVKTEIAETGVVGVLHGELPGPVIALRADMDALPIVEETDISFASKAKGIFNGKEVGIMHACGHDVHTSILMGVATVLVQIREHIPGTIKFIFQPAEEGVYSSKLWGAKQMIKEGVLANPKPDAIFGLHVWPLETGSIGYRSGAFMASVDDFKIEIKGKGAHGAMPWGGVDPIVVGAQIVTALQSIVSRNIALNEGGAVVTVGSFQAGTRNNIIPDTAELLGTVRSYNDTARLVLHKRLEELVHGIAKSFGAEAKVEIVTKYPATINHEDLSSEMLPVLKEVSSKVEKIFPVMAAEDFSFYQKEIPGMYFFLGIIPPGTPKEKIEVNHSPRWIVDEQAISTGVKALSYLSLKYLMNR